LSFRSLLSGASGEGEGQPYWVTLAFNLSETVGVNVGVHMGWISYGSGGGLMGFLADLQ